MYSNGKSTLENLMRELEPAIKTAERYKVMLAIENGRHTRLRLILAAFIRAAESEWVGVCFDMGNPLTVPENPVESAVTLAPFCKSVHLKDWQIFRTAEGAMLVNCPIGEGVLEHTSILQKLTQQQAQLPVFLQTVAERIHVPALDDKFLQQYPRITARALAGLLRYGTLVYADEEMRFPYECKAAESKILEWEEERLQHSLKQAQKLMGMDSLTLPISDFAPERKPAARKDKRKAAR